MGVVHATIISHRAPSGIGRAPHLRGADTDIRGANTPSEVAGRHG